jgi:choline dehydrogenase-like flavoprotein
MKDAMATMTRIHLAAGATTVITLHGKSVQVSSESDLNRLEAASYGPHEHVIFTAHQMGGMAMGADPKRHPVDPQHRLRGTQNVFVVDGSVFPTASGVNPSETIYALAHRAVDFVAAAV